MLLYCSWRWGRSWGALHLSAQMVDAGSNLSLSLVLRLCVHGCFDSSLSSSTRRSCTSRAFVGEFRLVAEHENY